jgi:hypothetical protein
VPNPEIRMPFNWTMGRRKPEAREQRMPAAAGDEAAGAQIHRVFPRPAE